MTNKDLSKVRTNPNSLANLKPVKPGQVLNPTGKGGPKPGYKHKITEIKEAIASAFNKEDFIKWSKKKANQATFYKLMIQMFPKELELDPESVGSIILIRPNPNTPSPTINIPEGAITEAIKGSTEVKSIEAEAESIEKDTTISDLKISKSVQLKAEPITIKRAE